jgi:hypothetical protein
MKTILFLLAAGATLAAAPGLAHAQAGHPDFTGVWTITPYTGALQPADGQPIPFKPEAKAAYERNLAAAKAGAKSWDPASACLPEGLPRLMIVNEPFEIMQRDKAVYFVGQNRVPWKAFFNEPLPTDPDPFYMGYSVAGWEGPALVVDSTGFRDLTLLDDRGVPPYGAVAAVDPVPPGPGRQDHDGRLHHHRSGRLHASMDGDGDLREEAGRLPAAGRGVRRKARQHGAQALSRPIRVSLAMAGDTRTGRRTIDLDQRRAA